MTFDGDKLTAERKEKEMKSIVFLDLDGTLWEYERIPDSALKAIHQAQQNGHLIFANTGRSRNSSWNSLKSLPLNGQVYSAGSEIWVKDKRIFFAPLGIEKTKRLLEMLAPLDVPITIEGSFFNGANLKGNEMMNDFISKNLASALAQQKTIRFEEMKEEDYANAMKMMIFKVNPKELTFILEKEEMSFTFTPEAPHLKEQSLVSGELTQRALTKGTAFEEIKKYLKGNYRTVAIGDSENDLPMFEKADLAIAMGNGTDIAKEKADWVTTSIEKDGIYHAFEYAGLL